MNGAVFHTSAMITAKRAAQGSVVQWIVVPNRELTMPWSAKINCHSFAVTAVGIAQGTSTAARSRPRPANARFMTSAIHRPSIVSKVTVTTVKNRVIFSAGQKSMDSWPGAHSATTPEGVMHRCVSQYR